MELGVVAGVVTIGIIHGVLPDHGWPIAAAYALARRRKWLAGIVAGLVLGIGHLVSSIALVLAYFWFSRFSAVAEGPWMRYAAGGLLVLLGAREYFHGRRSDHEHHHGWGDSAAPEPHSHAGSTHRLDDYPPDPDPPHRADSDPSGSDSSHQTSSDPPHHADPDSPHHADRSHDHRADAPHEQSGVWTRFRSRLLAGRSARPSGNQEPVERGLVALGSTALLLGFAHEEPIQILAICAGTPFCLELMLIYSLAVIVAILVPTLLLIAGYERHRDTVEAYTPHLPVVTAVVLVSMGLGFIAGVL